MIETAIITRVDEKGHTFVKRLKGKECQGCTACDMFGGSSPDIEIENTIHAKSGDIVMIAVPGQNMLMAAAIVFLLPIFMMILGYFVGTRIFSEISDSAETYRILFSFLFLGASFFLVRLIDSKLKNKSGILPKTTNFSNFSGVEPEQCSSITG